MLGARGVWIVVDALRAGLCTYFLPTQKIPTRPVIFGYWLTHLLPTRANTSMGKYPYPPTHLKSGMGMSWVCWSLVCVPRMQVRRAVRAGESASSVKFDVDVGRAVVDELPCAAVSPPAVDILALEYRK